MLVSLSWAVSQSEEIKSSTPSTFAPSKMPNKVLSKVSVLSDLSSQHGGNRPQEGRERMGGHVQVVLFDAPGR